VSSLEQADSGISLAAQADRIRAYCSMQGWECVDVVRDDGYSGKDLKRPAIQRVLHEARTRRGRRFDAVVVTKLDRLTRPMKDLLALTTAADRHGLAVVSIQEAVDTATATGQLFRTIITALSEWERGTIAERTREALAFKRRNGERVGSIPYGFALAEDGKQLVPVPAELAVVERICAERRAGVTFEAIAVALNARSVVTKCGGRWYAASVRSVYLTAERRGDAMRERGGGAAAPLLRRGNGTTVSPREKGAAALRGSAHSEARDGR
jgi:site-specific DNA recombinase